MTYFTRSFDQFIDAYPPSCNDEIPSQEADLFTFLYDGLAQINPCGRLMSTH